MRIAGFDWDNGNWPKCGKHGVAQVEIEAMLSGTPSILPDPAHSSAEQRFLAIGQTPSGRPLLVAFTLRRQGAHWLLRPVSARFMHAPASCIPRRFATMPGKLKTIPELTSDADAERFVAEADLTQYDLSGFRPASFEFEKKAAQINMRVPEALLEAVKSRARAQGMPFTRYIRLLMERDVARS